MNNNRIDTIDAAADLRLFRIREADVLDDRLAAALTRVWQHVPVADRADLSEGMLVCVVEEPAPVATAGVWEIARATVDGADERQLDAHLAGVLAGRLSERRAERMLGFEVEDVGEVVKRWGLAPSGVGNFAAFVAGVF